jgi:hypothetical protein
MLKEIEPYSVRHTLLMPVDLRVESLTQFRRRLRPRSMDAEDKASGDELVFTWESMERREVAASSTEGALWDLMKLVEPSTETIMDLTQKWGMPSATWERDSPWGRFQAPDGTFGLGVIEVDSWRDFAASVRQFLMLLGLTYQESLVDEAFLKSIQTWEPLPRMPEIEWTPALTREGTDALGSRLGVPPGGDLNREIVRRREERRWQSLLKEFREGRGLAQQRRLLANRLTSLLSMKGATFVWDEDRRAVEREAIGLDEIVLTHIATIFLAPEVNVLICSVCGAPFPFDDALQTRRPRYGVRRFCGQACRLEAKRESNRLSWGRNSRRWTRKRRGE